MRYHLHSGPTAEVASIGFAAQGAYERPLWVCVVLVVLRGAKTLAFRFDVRSAQAPNTSKRPLRRSRVIVVGTCAAPRRGVRDGGSDFSVRRLFEAELLQRDSKERRRTEET